MSYQRVNLLNKNEQRYQGAVSRRFILISVVVAPILLIAVLSGIRLVQYSGLQSELKAKRLIWEDLEPKLELFKEESHSLQVNNKILSLFEGWGNSQLSMVEMMDQIQDVVPQNIRFSRLSLRGDAPPASYETPEDMALGYNLSIEGSAEGERAEEDIWQFHRDLLSSSTITATFDTVDLANMRKRQNRTGASIREFRIMGANTEGGGK